MEFQFSLYHSKAMNTRGRLLIFVFVLTWIAGSAVAQTPPPYGYGLRTISLTGPEYDYTSGGATYRNGVAQSLNASGKTIGYSQRFDSSGNGLGEDVWLFDGATTRVISLTGIGYEGSSTFGTYRYAVPTSLNAAGQAIGTSDRVTTSGYGGVDSWFFDGATTRAINLTGTGYEYNFNGSLFRNSSAASLNAFGQVAGVNERFTQTGGALGYDAWFFDGVSTRRINLAGSGYEYTSGGGAFRNGIANYPLNNAGNVLGISYRYSPGGISLGQDAWLFNGSTTRVIGLTGSGYEYTNATGTHRYGAQAGLFSDSAVPDKQINAAGQAVGNSWRYSSTGIGLGQEAWVFDGTSTRAISLTGAPYDYTSLGRTIRYSYAQMINESRQAIGYSYRYLSNGDTIGKDAWFFDGSTTRVVGLMGTAYEANSGGVIIRDSEVRQLNDAGQVIGNTTRDGSGGGQDSWLFDGTTTRLISLTGPGYERAVSGGILRAGYVLQLNDAGQAIGWNNRYTSDGDLAGRAGWFYDDDTNLTSALEFSTYTKPQYLTQEGVVLGSYSLYRGDNQPAYAFWWSIDGGFHDLGLLVNGGLNASGWSTLASVYDEWAPAAAGIAPGGAPAYIIGNGLTLGQGGGQTVFQLSGVPEPHLLGAAGFGLLLLGRRCRR